MIYCRKRPNEQKQRNQLFICTKFNLQIYNSFIYTASKKKKKKVDETAKKTKNDASKWRTCSARVAFSAEMLKALFTL